MKLNNRQIDELTSVTERIRGKKIPISTGLILAANFEAIFPLANIYRQTKDELIKKHAELNEDGEPVVFEEEGKKYYKIANKKDLADETQQASETELEVNITKIPVSEIELFSAEKYDALTLEEIASLMVIVDEEESEVGDRK